MVDIVGLRMLFSPTYAPNLRAIDIVGSIDETIVFNFGARFYDDEIYFLNKSWLYMFKNMKDRAEIKAYLSYDLFPLSILLVALIIAVSPWLCSHLLPHFCLTTINASSNLFFSSLSLADYPYTLRIVRMPYKYGRLGQSTFKCLY